MKSLAYEAEQYNEKVLSQSVYTYRKELEELLDKLIKLLDEHKDVEKLMIMKTYHKSSSDPDPIDFKKEIETFLGNKKIKRYILKTDKNVAKDAPSIRRYQTDFFLCRNKNFDPNDEPISEKDIKNFFNYEPSFKK